MKRSPSAPLTARIVPPSTRRALLPMLALVAACAAPGDRDLDQVPQRVAVATTDVKAALIASPDVSAAAIRVSLEGDRIVLSGFVDDADEREAAARVAGDAGAGRRVDNRLEIR